MKTTMTAVALVLALGTAVQAQDVKPSTTPAAPAVSTPSVTAPAATTPAVTAPAAKPVLAPDQMQKVGAPAAPVAPAAAPKVEAKPAVAPTTPAVTKTTAPAAAVKLLNINTVSAADLEKLPKIGEARAKQIVAGRPYKSLEDLTAKKVLPQDAFDAIKGLVSVK